jgi:hypothetical protein
MPCFCFYDVMPKKINLFEYIAGKQNIQLLSAAKWPIIDTNISPYASDHVHFVSFKENSGMLTTAIKNVSISGAKKTKVNDPDNDATEVTLFFFFCFLLLDKVLLNNSMALVCVYCC